jgi:4'-phosphopantetheinyl transferase
VRTVEPGFIDVWSANLANADESYAQLLSDDERERVSRFIRTAHGGRWATARGILRALLAEYLDIDPQSLRFELGEHGKPAIAEPRTNLRFNVSHARSTALIAIADGAEIGVDVEHLDRRVDAVRVARRIFGADEAGRLQTLDPDARQREFLRAWVRHEAIVKCLGTGIGAYRTAEHAGAEPSVIELDLGQATLGALAAIDHALQVRCHEWPP